MGRVRDLREETDDAKSGSRKSRSSGSCGSRRRERRRRTFAASTGSAAATFYKWKAKYGGLDVSDAKRLKALEDENAKLKKLLAEAMLDNAMLKDMQQPKMVTPAASGRPWLMRARCMR